jgi:hypothetical protein
MGYVKIKPMATPVFVLMDTRAISVKRKLMNVKAILVFMGSA